MTSEGGLGLDDVIKKNVLGIVIASSEDLVLLSAVVQCQHMKDVNI